MQRFKPTAKHLAEIVADAMSPALAAKGFAGREVVARWADIVGDRLGARSRPQRIEWPRQRPGADGETHQAAALVVLVESAFAPELQHAAPVILSRINAHLGWPAVGRVVLKQGPVAPPRTADALPPPLDPATRERVVSAAGTIGDDAVREAVTRLGLAVARRRGT